MGDAKMNILLVEDNMGDARLVEEMLQGTSPIDYNLIHTEDLKTSVEYLADHQIDIILLDLGLPDSVGLQTFIDLYKIAPQIPIIVFSGIDDEELAMTTMKIGAQDYLIKGHIDNMLFPRVIKYSIERKRIYEELRASEKRLKSFLDAAPEAILIFDRDLKVIDINRVALQKFKRHGKMTGEMMIGKHITQVSPDVEEKGRLDMFKEVMKTGIPAEIEEMVTYPILGKRSYALTAFKVGEGLGLIEYDNTELKRAEEILRDRTKNEIFALLASALPVFASNTPTGIRDVLISNFSERFERNMRPRFKERFDGTQHDRSVLKAVDDDIFKIYTDWVLELFSNFGTDISMSEKKPRKAILRIRSCTWTEEGDRNPIYCHICRAMIMRSFTWTGLAGQVNQRSSMAGGGDECIFEINLRGKDQ